MYSRRIALSFFAVIVLIALFLAPIALDAWLRDGREPAFDAVANPSGLAWGESANLPPISFRLWRNALEERSADFLDRVGKDLVGAGLENFDVTVDAQHIVAGSKARLQTAAQALAATSKGRDWQNLYVQGYQPSRTSDWLHDFNLGRRSAAITVTRTGVTGGDPADWSLVPNGPSADAIFGFTFPEDVRRFALSDARVAKNTSGTIDFFVSPEWRHLNGYDPIILSIGDSLGPRFEVHILDKRDGIAIWDGSQSNYVSLSYNFTADKVYHITLVTMGGQTTVVVDDTTVPGTLPAGYGPTAAETLVLGAGALGDDRFYGRLGRVRLWSDALVFDQYSRLAALPETLDIGDPLREKLVAITQFDASTQSLVLNDVPALAAPRPGWWSPAGAADIRIHNLAAFAAGREAPQFSPLQVALANSADGGASSATTSGDEAPNQEEDVFNPQFAVHELYKLVRDDGVDLASFQLPAGLHGQTTESSNWSDQFNEMTGRADPPGRSLVIVQDADGVASVSGAMCANIVSGADPLTCADATANSAFFVLAPNEYVRGVTWLQTKDRHLRKLRFITNKRVSDAYGELNLVFEGDATAYSIWMPPGARPQGYAVHYDSTPTKHAVGFELVPPAGVAKPSVTLISDSGGAARFARESETSFATLDPDSSNWQSSNRPAKRHLTVLDETRIQADGVDHELALLPARGAVKPTTGFNDTFVALSKAVNLQANYVGYNLLSMDPLHLSKAGTEKRIFAMPSGDSFDYYDANHVFVPSGLIYVPEFTGQNYATVHSADTYSQYRDSFSDTVSAGISGKLAPVSFSMSSRMSTARQSISEDSISKTLGLSKAIFYDLTLDKAHMALDPGFIHEVNELQRSGHYIDFVAQFGTHYPAAIVYGGLGVLEIDVTESMRETLLEKGVGVKIETSILLDADTETSASFGMEHEEDHQQTFRSTVGSQVDNFYWIGGAHAGGDKSSWSVGTDGVVPVHINLRRIEELLSPVYFDDPDIYNRVRKELGAYIDRTMNDALKSLPIDSPAAQYDLEVRLDKVVCSVTPDASNEKGGYTAGSDGSISSTVVVKTQAPIILMDFLAPPYVYKDFADTPDPPNTTYTSFSANCPSDVDLIPTSDYLKNHVLARYRVTAGDLANTSNLIAIYDRRDLESDLIAPKDSENPTLKALLEIVNPAALAIDLLSPTGSPLVNPFLPKGAAPVAVTTMSTANQVLCEETNGGCPLQPGPVTPDFLDAALGHWFQHTISTAAGVGCISCAEREVTFSVRVVR